VRRVVRRFAEVMSPTQVLARISGFPLTQEPEDLFFKKIDSLRPTSVVRAVGLQTSVALNLGGSRFSLPQVYSERRRYPSQHVPAVLVHRRTQQHDVAVDR